MRIPDLSFDHIASALVAVTGLDFERLRGAWLLRAAGRSMP